MVQLSVEARQELVWWTQEMQECVQWGSIDDVYSRHGDRVRCFSPWLESNLEGPRAEDGRTLVNQRTRGAHHCLELLAASLAIQTFAKEKRNIRILVRTDNVSTRACINHFGGLLMANESLSHADMEVVHRAPDILDSRAFPRGVELGSG